MNNFKTLLGISILLGSAALAFGQPTLTDLSAEMTIGGTTGLEPPFDPSVHHYVLPVLADIKDLRLRPSFSPASEAILRYEGEPVTPGQAIRLTPPAGESLVTLSLSEPQGEPVEYTIAIRKENLRPVADQFLKLSWTDPQSGLKLRYRLFIPQDYDQAKTYPLVLFLHGSGETGNENAAQLFGSRGATVWAKPEEQSRHPCFVLAPQNPLTSPGWTTLRDPNPGAKFTPAPILSSVWALVEVLMAQYSLDSDRIYATGVSMGGYGVFALASQHPRELAAVVPVCGGMDLSLASSAAALPFWIFHAAADPTVPVQWSRDASAALSAAGGHPRFTEYPVEAQFDTTAHFSWIPAYADAAMRDWLFDQKRPGPRLQ